MEQSELFYLTSQISDLMSKSSSFLDMFACYHKKVTSELKDNALTIWWDMYDHTIMLYNSLAQAGISRAECPSLPDLAATLQTQSIPEIPALLAGKEGKEIADRFDLIHLVTLVEIDLSTMGLRLLRETSKKKRASTPSKIAQKDKELRRRRASWIRDLKRSNPKLSYNAIAIRASEESQFRDVIGGITGWQVRNILLGNSWV